MRERVYSVWDFYDGPRTGVADFSNVPCHFESLWNEELDDFANSYVLRELTASIRETANEYDRIWRTWERRFLAGTTSGETHPKGTDSRFDELTRILDVEIHQLEVIGIRVPEFTAKRGQENLTEGTVKELQVEWLEPLPNKRMKSFVALAAAQRLPRALFER